MENKDNRNEDQTVDISTLQALKIILDLGGENADLIANASNEEINELMQKVDKIRIIV